MRQEVVCVLCDKPERDCQCDRYCNLCKAQHSIRMCQDGQYYCPECREACDIHTVDNA
jgi:hypothetical protein